MPLSGDNRITPPHYTPLLATEHEKATPAATNDKTITPITPLTPPSRQMSAPTPLPSTDAYPTSRDVPGAAAQISGVADAVSTTEGKAVGSTKPAEKATRSPILWISIAGLVVAALVLFVVPPLISSSSDGGQPTPFPGASQAERPPFSINVPSDWAFSERVDDQRQSGIWRQDDQAFVSVSWVENADIMSAASFDYAIERYQRRYYDPQDYLTPFDQFVSDQGWMRESYQLLDGSENGQFPPGQMDVFYLRHDPYLVVLETFTAYSTGDDYVATMQLILDSLRIDELNG